LDFKALETSIDDSQDEFLEILVDRLADFPFLHNWMGFAIALSSFPAAIKLKPGEIKVYPRTDLSLYRRLISNPRALLRTPMFGDYALDTSPIEKPQRRTPSAHLRYSTPILYAVAKGTSVKKPYGYEAIFPVADLLAAQFYFAGASYSAGDEHIEAIHKRVASSGNAARWRWASTDHHLTVNIDAIAEMYGLSRIPVPLHLDSPPTQGELFPASEVTSNEDKAKK
jgi:hypothetical protein